MAFLFNPSKHIKNESKKVFKKFSLCGNRDYLIHITRSEEHIKQFNN